jgi:hypothetical protein
MTTVFDIETNGLLDVLTKIHVLSYSHDGKEVKHTHDYDEMRKFFTETETLVGHNIIRFDIPAVEKVLGIKVNARLVDTLALSWYLNHDRQKHGLEGYGVDYGVPKPVIKDWDSLTAEEYAHRCDEDVKINSRLWRDLDIKLNKLYQDKEEKDRLIDYLSFKMDCAREQEALRSSAMTMTVVTGEERGNPNSNDQVKDWLYSLGWKPRTYKFIRDKKTGDERQVEQIRKDGELCDSVKELVSVDPAVDLLDGLTVLTHRAGILKSFLECVSEDGYLQATVAGLTNTFRFKHMKPLVNLPSVDKPYGDIIRGVLTCPDGYVLAGADMTSLEDTTKRHYMKPLDPDYVEEMSREGFDPHLDLAKHAGVITQEDIDKHNSGERSLKSLRKNYKVVNYSATYGIGAPKLAREMGMSVKEAKTLLEAFWSRNWSVEAVAKSLLTRELFDSMWVYNPVSKFWYALRSDKDRFSTLNQGTGVFCFDTWVAICRKNGIKTIGQFHDEIVALVEEGKQEEVQAIMHGAAIKLNEKVKLNVPLGCDAQFGKTYGEIH